MEHHGTSWNIMEHHGTLKKMVFDEFDDAEITMVDPSRI
jgi:hypothetical protein